MYSRFGYPYPAMLPTLVFADNLTGACEIAGIASRAGLKTRLSMDPEPPSAKADSLLIVDTETRRLSAAQASARLEYFLAVVPREARVFKKCDSVLRGNVAAEISVLASHLRRPISLLVPANPLLERRIRGGQYLVGDLPLHRTPLGRDPLHPIFTDRVTQLVGSWSGPGPSAPVSIDPEHALPGAGLVIAGTETVADMDKWVSRLNSTILPAGSAAFFERMLTAAPNAVAPIDMRFLQLPTLLISGSNTPKQRTLLESAAETVALSLEELERRGDAALTAWRKRVMRQMKEGGRAFVYIDDSMTSDPAVQARIACAFALITEAMAAKFGSKPWHLIIEGGATAAAIAAALGRRRFRVLQDWGPGVVTLDNESGIQPWLTLKPSSYPWPTSLQEHLFPTFAEATESLPGTGLSSPGWGD